MSAKRARLDDLGRFRASLPYMSQSALGEILRRTSAEILPPRAHRRLIRAARDAIATRSTPYGEVHQMMSVASALGDATIEICHPAAYMYAASEIPAIQHLINAALDRRASGDTSSPLHVIVYGDEVTPGNAVAHKNRRKSWAIYYSFLELGEELLCHEDTVFET